MMIHTFEVSPSLPARLEKLRDLAQNLYFSWTPSAITLFTRLDPDLWEQVQHNPVAFLGRVSQKRLEEAEKDEGYLATLDRSHEEFRRAVEGTRTWYASGDTRPPDMMVAYFAMEYGLHECLPLYSGGLGMLSGDHLKSASELGVPLVGLGLLYQKGYFRQHLNLEGYQKESYVENDFSTMPMRIVRDEQGKPRIVHIALAGRDLALQIWRLDVGRTRLFLLDTNLPSNDRADQDLTDFLYGGDAETRILQEIILGIGGVRALAVMGMKPSVHHMNEGHAAFMGLELIREMMVADKVDFGTAREITTSSSCFTTHTPVPAGTDEFEVKLVEKYFKDYYPALGLDLSGFMDLGRLEPGQKDAPLNMTVLAMRLSQQRNGVARLHGEVARSMWQSLWPGMRTDEVPITHITNGVYHKTWLSPEMRQLFDRYLGPRWRQDPANPATWDRVDQIPALELWRTHERRRERLVAFTRRRLAEQLSRRNAPRAEVRAANEVMNPEALTIGFARRFAAYKRATLMFRDPDRLARLVNDLDRPVQVILAGKAHPRDEAGKDLIRRIVGTAREERFRFKVVFLENYDMEVARYMVQGVDVWLNTPRRPNEASGTSGMKAAVNGAIHMSVLDGWWDEAYEPEVGWAIGSGETYEDLEMQDEIESRAIMDLLEKEVVPLFYERGPDGVPRGWTELMKASLQRLCPMFTSNRMVQEYTDRFYLKAHRRRGSLRAEEGRRANNLALWKNKIREGWPEVKVLDIHADTRGLKVGDNLKITAVVHLGKLDPSDVVVLVHRGPLDQHGTIVNGITLTMSPCDRTEDGAVMCSSDAPLRYSGRQGYTVRVVPRHDDLQDLVDLPLVAWG